ncbi:MAG: glycine cleavage system protein R [Aliiglaciecola sp.]|uniref:glycine cleavage system protein R n=1 Tax=Aliiglaciecola sp. M165 TaxID=2593649 RepID=UPI00118092E9|nr:ACT domain-containing protein [Aliiglaciecola sp. M165]TRY30179.1 glycine cleavage system transcriptional repressor [Aliiglaciecola sp. M165]
MKQQLIVTILGANNVGILSEIANTVSETGCNILDSRQAIYGEDFSLTMILEGSQSEVTKAEIKLPQTCQRLDLLSMMKRTKRHCKQNLEHLVDVQVMGDDTPGVIHKVSALLANFDAAISAMRQNTFTDQDAQKEKMKIKFVASVPACADMKQLQDEFTRLLGSLGLDGNITENH